VTLPSPTVTVVVPAWRAAAHLAACLDGFARQEAPAERFEVVVVDDRSPDDSAAIAEAAGVRLVRHERNRGAAASRNTGARAARGRVLLFVDSDVVPDPGLVAAVLDLYDDGGPAAATGRYAPEPANDTRFARYKALWTFFCWERTGAATGQSSHVQGALAVLRGDVFEALGGFDEAYAGGNVEDYELSARLKDQGHRIVFDDRIRGRHHFPGFGTVARNYWDRTRMWTRLRGELKGFSSGQASARSAAAALFALGSALGHAALPVAPPLLPLVVVADAGWLASAAPFLRFVARREGPAFALYAGGVHYALSVVIGAAALSSPLGRGSRGPDAATT
jgi:glycosyltransferase involved in cell wall biosynthesis